MIFGEKQQFLRVFELNLIESKFKRKIFLVNEVVEVLMRIVKNFNNFCEKFRKNWEKLKFKSLEKTGFCRRSKVDKITNVLKEEELIGEWGF